MTTSPKVQIAFDLTLAGAGNFFTINSTPVGGTAISGALPLAGDVLVDVTDDARAISVRRGRSRETDRFDAGVATVLMDNRDRLYDPAAGTAVSPYSPSLVPRKALTIEANGQAIFTGQIEDIDLQYDPNQDNTTIFKASDAFTLLNQVILTPGTATSELTGDRVNTILDDAAWPTARRDIDTGFATLGADVIGNGVNALEYLNKIATSEPGGIFVARDGAVAFRDRGAAQTLTGVKFADDGTGIPFSELVVEYGTERLFNSIEVVFTGGTATAVNTVSQIDYGINSLIVNTLLQSGSDPQNLADYYSNLYGQPVVRFNKLTIPINGLSGTELGDVLSLDLGDAVEVKFTPNGIGSPIEQVVVIESIEHTIRPQNHSMSLTLSGSQAAFILDTSQLDVDALGF